METVSSSPQETSYFAEQLCDTLKCGEKAQVIALEGELGSGKTTFMQALANKMGVSEDILSPTFVILKEYKTHHGPFQNLIHIDAYRLNNAEDLLKLGIEDKIKNSNTAIVIEWANRVREILPSNTITIHFEHVDETTRKISTH